MMKRLYILTGLMFLSVVIFGQGIQFEKGKLAVALKKARDEGKMVFIDAYAVWCAPCKLMANTVFKDAEVGRYFDEQVVAVKIDVERGEGPRVKEKYAIEGLPGYVFMDGEGNVVYRDKGSMSKEKFLGVVKQAYAYMLDSNSVGRLAARYSNEKDDESFLKIYLQKLHESRSVGHVDVLEQYLAVQQTIRPDSREMAKLLDDHYKSLIYGGRADAIIQKYSKCDAWRKYVRKEVRERFLELPKTMAQRTTDYGIEKRDSSYIDLSIRRAKEEGMAVAEGQRQSLMVYFYKNTGMGEAYKSAVLPGIENLYKTTNVKDLYGMHMNTRKKYANEPDVRYRTHAMKASMQLRTLISDFAVFVTTDVEKAEVLKWSKMVYELTPDDFEAVSFYANALYLFGDKTEALKLKLDACRLAAGNKTAEALEIDYKRMQAGETIVL